MKEIENDSKISVYAKTINKAQENESNTHVEDELQYDSTLCYLAKNYKIFVDTCSLMHNEFSVFYMHMKEKNDRRKK